MKLSALWSGRGSPVSIEGQPGQNGCGRFGSIRIQRASRQAVKPLTTMVPTKNQYRTVRSVGSKGSVISILLQSDVLPDWTRQSALRFKRLAGDALPDNVVNLCLRCWG